jgi:hypothetical protein
LSSWLFLGGDSGDDAAVGGDFGDVGGGGGGGTSASCCIFCRSAGSVFIILVL